MVLSKSDNFSHAAPPPAGAPSPALQPRPTAEQNRAGPSRAKDKDRVGACASLRATPTEARTDGVARPYLRCQPRPNRGPAGKHKHSVRVPPGARLKPSARTDSSALRQSQAGPRHSPPSPPARYLLPRAAHAHHYHQHHGEPDRPAAPRPASLPREAGAAGRPVPGRLLLPRRRYCSWLRQVLLLFSGSWL